MQTLQYSAFHTHTHLEEHPAVATRITLGSILHGIGRLGRHVRDRRTMREEQDLDRNSQTGVQCNDNDQQNAGWLCVDGRDDWVSVGFKRLVLVARKEKMSIRFQHTSF